MPFGRVMLRGVRDLEREVFAGELRPSRPLHPVTARPPLIRQALVTGAVAGGVPGAIVFAIYYGMHSQLPLPWIRVASVLAVFAPFAGMALAGSVQAMVLAFDRIARLGRGVGLIANPVLAGLIGGALGGIAPGAISVITFGSYHGPFLGTALIAFPVISGSIYIAGMIALRARRARLGRTPGDKRMIAIATIAAGVILLAVAAVVAPALVDGAFAEAQRRAGSIAEKGGMIGAIAGAIGGTLVGIYIGMVIAIGRSLRPRRKP
jgi:hypothetical protein